MSKALITLSITSTLLFASTGYTHAEPTNSDHLRANDVETEIEATDLEPIFGKKGYKTWYIQGAAATTLDNLEPDPRRFGLVGVGISEFLFNRHSINLEFNTIYFDQPGENAVGFNLALLGRWHFVQKENWSTYFDAGAGVMGTTNDVPRQAAAFNFTPQLGGGVSLKLNQDRHLLLGLRWHHISHGETHGRNPGRDSLMGYVRLDMPR